MATSGWRRRSSTAARIPLIGLRGRHPDIDDGQVRPVLRGGPEQPVGVAHRGQHLVALVLEQRRDPLAKQREVLGDHHLHSGILYGE